MDARRMVSFFLSTHSDYDVEDVSNRPLAAHVTVTADSPDKCGFKSTQPVKVAQPTISIKRIFHYAKTKE